MRVLFWSEHFWPYIGGGEVFATKLIIALRERGYEFAVLTSHDYLQLPDQAYYQDIPIYRFSFREALTSGDLACIHRLCRKVTEIKKDFAPDIVHVNAVSPSALFHLWTTDAYPAPTLVRMNQESLVEDDARLNTLTGRVLHAADWVCCVASLALAQVNHLIPNLGARSSLIYNGVEPPELPTPLCFDPPILLCLGRLVPAKGFDVALKALTSLTDRHSNARLLIAGDGPMRADLECMANTLGLRQRVTFLGWVEPNKVPALINTATMVLMPSWREGLPTVALQAAAMARPVVASRAGGLMDVVAHQQTGWLCAKGDSAGLAEAITFLLNNPAAAATMGLAGRKRVQQLFSWSGCVDAYNDLYWKLIEECPSHDSVTSRGKQSSSTA